MLSSRVCGAKGGRDWRHVSQNDAAEEYFPLRALLLFPSGVSASPAPPPVKYSSVIVFSLLFLATLFILLFSSSSYQGLLEPSMQCL